ncbi:MAG: 2-hydroxy-6-ketonona-2,4-dienedioic acid hydrolase [Betaproteobacteria bacterium HGW-Betaproteobacteria-19]|nr:MAG: 2-hydroxy-6-ketonona-2,4-dienedioic acid hydrolase [Betaproteobacteria bacterium HGW-Betaproteobacteria-19]
MTVPSASSVPATGSTEPAEPASRFVTVEGVRMHYRELDGPASSLPVIFTHGGGPGSTGWNNFRHSAQAFSARHRCYFVDLPQFGQSDMVPIDGPVFSWHAAKLLGFMDALGIERAHLVNQSFGGCVAIRLAADHPQRIGRMVLISAQPVDRGVLAPLPLFSKHGKSIIRDYFAGDGGPSLQKMRELIARLEFHDDAKVDDDNVRLRFEASANPAFQTLLATPGAFGRGENLAPLLSRVNTPTLIFWGLHDWFGAVDVPMLMLNHLGDARLHVVGKGAHHLQTECPEEFNPTALSFLGGAEA